MTPQTHLDETMMTDHNGIYIPAIPLPLFTHRSIFKQAYQCFCGETFKSMAEYRYHYRTEQMVEMNGKMARTRDLAKAKELYWRRRAFVFENGTDDDKSEAMDIETPEMKTLPEVEMLIARITDVWEPVYNKWGKDNDVSLGRMLDETEVTDEAPERAAKDLDDKCYSHTNSKGVTYFLHETEVTLRGGKPHTIYFFRKAPEVNHEKYKPALLPEGFIVRENPTNGFLTVGRKENHEG